MAKIETAEDLRIWRLHLRAKNEAPDAEITQRLGRDWARVRTVICPICGAAFYGWQCIQSPLPPTQRDYADGTGQRVTCGDPLCHESESVYQHKKVQVAYLAKTAGQNQTDAKPSRKGNL